MHTQTESIPQLAPGSRLLAPPLKRESDGHWFGNAHTHRGSGLEWCFVEIAPGVGVMATKLKDGQVLLQGCRERYDKFPDHPVYSYESAYWYAYYMLGQGEPMSDPFIEVEVVGQAYHSTFTVPRYGGTQTYPDGYQDRLEGPGQTFNRKLQNSKYPDQLYATPYTFLPLRITLKETGESLTTDMRFMVPKGGDIDLDILPENPAHQHPFNLVRTTRIADLDINAIYSVDTLCDLLPLLEGGIFKVKQSKDQIWEWFFEAHNTPRTLAKAESAGVGSLWKRKDYKEALDRLATEEPLLNRFLLWLMDKSTDNKTTNNKLLKAFIETCGTDFTKLRDALRDVMDRAPEIGTYRSNGYGKDLYNRSLCLALPGAADAEQDRKAKEAWQYQKTMTGQAGGLGISEEKHPTLFGLVAAGDIPLSIFHAPGNKQHIINNEFDLWEKALTTPGWKDPIVGIAKDVSRRTTYDKPVTPYLAFLMWTLPRYLDRVAPRPKGGSWSCVPKFVESQWELEMDEASEEGTVKRRSAMTPVADNETGVVTVPYLSMAVHGRMTTYCYSGKYYVSNQGETDPLGDGVWTHDYVEKLNGRDDYGLMFYTLIGTDRNTGYPSFLIILERLQKRQKSTGLETRVHFHRVRPNRSKNGVPTPTNQLVEECYRYMAGNVRAEEIENQQGDLIFIRVEKPGTAVEDPVPVRSFESHAFIPLEGSKPCTVIRSTAKSPTNRLGYLHSDTPFKVEHPEHEDIERLDAGWWEIRRCKSFEANPTAVWSLTID